jgi:hypothetical protein
MDVLYQESQTSLLREECSEVITILEMTDTTTGIKGHVYHEIATDKRDILEENFWTDTPALFENNHPEADRISELSGYGEPRCRRRTTVITSVIAACCKNQLEYREGNPDGATYKDKAWGLYLS